MSGAKPELGAKVPQGEVEGVGGRREAAPGRLAPHRPAGAICLQVQGKVAADGLHAVTQLLAQERVCKISSQFFTTADTQRMRLYIGCHRSQLTERACVRACSCVSLRWISK